ncbi:putative nuclease HARBI1 [Acipenser ruthenus]|uniref:Putative nuclease HARBI1 n=1 Tax=Acipenser ruthenus TaxID=7906 RepID=A0A662YRB2_ACIRT|nr:putative nuclease HARBI1 [Acipenser ruthenus]
MEVVCDSSLIIPHVCTNYPGSCHDAYILQQSSLSDLFQSANRPNSVLLGDSADQLLPWLLTPVLYPTTPAKLWYTDAHGGTKNVIERTFGLLKMCFRCLDRSGGALQYSSVQCAASRLHAASSTMLQ